MSAHSGDAVGPYAALYQATLDQAAQAGEFMMGTVLATARQALRERASLARGFVEREHLDLALKLLDSNARSMCEQYPQALKDAFNQTAPAAREGAGGSGRPVERMALLSSVNFDQLELMDSGQVHERVALARSQQSVLLAAETALAELNTYICATLGLRTVQPERNPLRTDVYVRALHSLINQTKVPAQVQTDWLMHMSDSLGQELSLLYSTLSAQLQAKGVVAAGYSVIRAFESSDRSGARAGQSSTSEFSERRRASDRVDESKDPVLTMDRLRRLLVGELDQPEKDNRIVSFSEQFSREFESAYDESGATDFQNTLPAAFEALQEMEQVDHVMARLDKRRQVTQAADARTLGRRTQREHSRGSSSELGQALSLEVVALMVENIVHDVRLLDPIKAVVQKLEPVLLRLSAVDPRFFIDKQHPARRLLDEITHRSLAFDRVDALGLTDFLTPLQQAVEPLAGMEIQDAEPFEQVLRELVQFWDAHHKPHQLDTAVQALQHAEDRNLRAEKIAREIKAWPEAANVSAGVLDFLMGPWSQVVAHVQLHDTSGAEDPGHYRELAAALLWSAQPELTRQKIGKLTQLIPKLLGKLREGLNLIDYPSLKTSVFFELLMNLHQQAFKPALPVVEPVVVVGLHPSLLEEVDTWVAPSEARASGFMEMPDALMPVESAPVAAPGDLLSYKPLVLEQDVVLPVGSWVEMLVKGAWVRSQLSWASPHGTLFLFTSTYGSTQSMTRRSRDKLLAAGTMRVISGQPVVDKALDAVVQSALLNSIDVNLF